MARNPFQRGFLGDATFGVASGFEKGLPQGVNLLLALSQQQMAQETAKQTAEINKMRLGLDLANYARTNQKDSDNDIFGGNTGDSNIIPTGGLPINGGSGGTTFPTVPFPKAPQFTPSNYTPINQGQPVQQAPQVQPQQVDPLATFYKTNIPTRSENHFLWAAQRRKMINESALSDSSRKNLLDRVDRLQGEGTNDTLKPFDKEIADAIEKSKLQGDSEDILRNAKTRIETIRDYAANANPQSVGTGKYGDIHLPFNLKIPGYVDLTQPLSGLNPIAAAGLGASIGALGGPITAVGSGLIAGGLAARGQRLSKEELDLGDTYEKLGLQEGIQALGGKTPKEGTIQRVFKDVPSPSQGFNTFKTEFKGYAKKAPQDYESTLKTIGEQYYIPDEYKKALKEYKTDPNIKKFIGDVSTPKKANAVVKAMVDQGMNPNMATQIVKKEAIKQAQQKKIQPKQKQPLNKQTTSTYRISNPTVPGGTELVMPKSLEQSGYITNPIEKIPIDSEGNRPLEAPEFYMNDSGVKKRGYAPYPSEAKPLDKKVSNTVRFINQLQPTEDNARKLALTIVRPGSSGMNIVHRKVLDNVNPNMLMMIDRALEMIENGEVA